jgi:hypothetical protein
MRGSARWTWRGLKPKQEAGVILTPWDQWMAAHAWAEAFELRVKPERVKVRPTGAALADVKRERVSAAIARWESKAKRAANALKKLRAKARYYDRRAAAMRGAR